MKREIKFRAWDGIAYDTTPTIWNGRVWDCRMDCEVEGAIIEQYTSLKDKNGIEIYEGDIVESEIYGKAFYVFEHGSFRWNRANHLAVTDQIVIGNIHQNPELL